MARLTLLDRKGPIRVLGVGMIVLLLFFVWLTYAFFNRSFESYEPISIKASNAGLSLPKNADVKIKGMIVGRVHDVEVKDHGVTIDAGIEPDDIDNIPADVTAQIVPKTLFGAKYIKLIPPDDETGETISAGATIERAEVPIEVEQLLNDIYPLLDAVKPAELNRTLSAMDEALDGRGAQLGDTLVQLNDYIDEIDPDVPQLITDLDKTGEVSDIYAGAAPDLGNILSNLVVTGDTVKTKRGELAGFFSNTTSLSHTGESFLDKNESNLLDVNDLAREPLDITRDYSDVFPCFLDTIGASVPLMDNVWRNQTLHIDVYPHGQSLTLPAFSDDEKAVLPAPEELNSTKGARASDMADMCDALESAAEGKPKYYHGKDTAYPGPSAEVYQLIGMDDSHQGKFRDEDDYERAPAAPDDAVIGGSHQHAQLKESMASILDTDAGDVPDIGALFADSLLDPTEVSPDGGDPR